MDQLVDLKRTLDEQLGVHRRGSRRMDRVLEVGRHRSIGILGPWNHLYYRGDIKIRSLD